jgi:hypothetical protein
VSAVKGEAPPAHGAAQQASLSARTPAAAPAARESSPRGDAAPPRKRSGLGRHREAVEQKLCALRRDPAARAQLKERVAEAEVVRRPTALRGGASMPAGCLKLIAVRSVCPSRLAVGPAAVDALQLTHC